MLDSHEKPNLVPAANANQEAQYISQQVLDLREEGVSLNEIAVLFRAAFHSQALEFELMRRDIPYEYRGGLKFFERAHVKDVVSHLRLCSNLKDEAAWMRVLSLQNGIGLVTAQKIIAKIREHESLSDLIDVDFKFAKKASIGWSSLHKLIKDLVKETMPSELIRAVVTSDYRDYLEAEYPDFMDRLEDIEQFALYAEGYDNLTKFLDEVSLTGEYGAVRESGSVEDERIVLSTIHQAKGLEWSAVFVMHLSDGKFPNPKALDETQGLEEERRLFYVATTRAKKSVHIHTNISFYDKIESTNFNKEYYEGELKEPLHYELILSHKDIFLSFQNNDIPKAIIKDIIITTKDNLITSFFDGQVTFLSSSSIPSKKPFLTSLWLTILIF